jgi:hypothetical protein
MKREILIFVEILVILLRSFSLLRDFRFAGIGVNRSLLFIMQSYLTGTIFLEKKTVRYNTVIYLFNRILLL